MKKALKITGITLASLVGVILVLATIAIALVTSPKRLTSMVKRYVPQYVDFDLQLQRANLTLFKTFPDIGLELDQVAILSPMEGAPSDTLASIDKLTLSADAKKFLKERQIIVKKLLLEDAYVNIFTDAEGHSNLDIFSSDSTKTDTTKAEFDYSVALEEVSLKNSTVLYNDLRSKLHAGITGLNTDIQGTMHEQDIQAVLGLKAQGVMLQTEGLTGAIQQLSLGFDGDLKEYNHLHGTLSIASPDLTLNAGYQVLQHDAVQIKLPVTMDINPLNASLAMASIGLNDYQITLDGNVIASDTNNYDLDLAFATNTLDIEDLMHYLPENVTNNLAGMQFQGKAALTDGTITGCFNDSTMPLITAKVNASDATIGIPSLPYPFKETNLSALMSIDLNDSINAKDIQLSTKLNRSTIEANGNITDLSGKMDLDMNLKSNLYLTDLKAFLPKNMKLNGRADAKVKLQSKLDDLMKAVNTLQFNTKTKADANITLNSFDFAMDTIHAASPTLKLNLGIPAKQHKGVHLGLTTSTLNATVGPKIRADLSDVNIEANADRLDKIEAALADAALKLGHLNLVYDTIRCDATNPAITLATSPKGNKNLNLSATLKSGQLNAKAGSGYQLVTQSLAVAASARQNKSKDPSDFLNHWNPTADFVLNNAQLTVANLDEKVIIPTIDFQFDDKGLDFKKGGVKLGKSDLNLKGQVTGLKEWTADKKNLMKANLAVHSNYLDLNEIMDLTSGLGVERDSTVVEDSNAEGDPFMVPEGVDFDLKVTANKALYRNFEFNDLGGNATIKDGTLLLREIGFTNEAAEMQLTAMYQSPRKNHLFLSMDFHLLNVQIYDLLHMIPEIDTIVPMLKTFDGAAEFHIAAQTNLKANYDLKMSTFRAAADIEAANLQVRDIASFTKITDMLKVSTNGLYKIDSLDIQMTAFKNEVDLWPFQIAIGKYKATLDGHYNLNTVGEYHISVTQSPLPTRLGLKISGPLNNLSYELEPCKYPNLYRPERRNDTEQMVMQLKKKIGEELRKGVREN